jgi:hypothetical protein
MKDAESLSKEQKKHISLYKEWRKGLTGVLIDLHWLRILGANSKILAMNTQMLGKAFGYLIDMALLPLVPAMVQFTKYVIGVAKWIRQLPQPARLLVAGLAALAIGVTTLGTILMYATSALTAFSAAVTAATAAETAKAGQTTLGMFGAGGAAVGGAAFGAAGVAGVGAGLGLGILNEKLLGTGPKATWNRYALISKLFGKDIPLMQEGGIATKPTMGIFGEGGAEAIIPLSKIGEVMGGILGAGASFANTLTQAATGGGGVGGGLTTGGKPTELLAKGFTWVTMAINQGFKTSNQLISAILTFLPNIGSFIFGGAINFAEWLKEKFLAGIDLARELADIIVAWFKKSLKDAFDFAEEIVGVIIEWFKLSLKETIDLATKLWNYIKKWIEDGLKNTIDLATNLWEHIEEWFKNSIGNAVDLATKILDILINWIKNGFNDPVGMALEVLGAIMEWVRRELSNAWDLVVKVGGVILEWIGREFASTFELITKVGGAVLEWVKKELSGAWDLITKIGGAIVEWVGKELGNVIGLVTSIKDKILEWLAKEFPNAVGLAVAIKDKIVHWVTSDLVSTPIKLAVSLAQAVVNFIKEKFGIDLGSLVGGGTGTGGGGVGGRSGDAPTTGGTVTPKPPYVSPPPTGTGTGATGGSASVGAGTTNPGSGWGSRGESTTGQTLYQPIVKAIRSFGEFGWQLWQVMDGLELWGPHGEKIGYNLAAMTIPKEALFDSCLASGGGWDWDTASCKGVPAMGTGGSITSNGLAFLHEGETVIPAAGVDRSNASGGVTINNPTFVISGRTERELFENFMRMMKSEGARVH